MISFSPIRVTLMVVEGGVSKPDKDLDREGCLGIKFWVFA
jgi:hypothetical protein